MADKEIAVGILLSKLPLFRELDASTVARLVEGVSRRPLRRGQILFRQGDAVGGMYVVVYGEIKLTTNALSRGERLSGMVGPGQSFAEPVMFLERKALVEAQASTDALLLYLPREVVFEEIERNPKFARGMIAGLSRRIENLVREIDRQATGSGTERLIAYLLRLARDMTDPALITLPVAKGAIASQLNLTPEHFSRILHELTLSGLVLVEGRKITIPDMRRLKLSTRSANPSKTGAGPAHITSNADKIGIDR